MDVLRRMYEELLNEKESQETEIEEMKDLKAEMELELENKIVLLEEEAKYIAPMQNKICDTVGFVVHVIKNWDVIVFNVTRPHIIYIDVRRLSVEQLSDWG